MPSGTATRPGDIITQLNGKTVEVNNTDAEGRLILADALTYCVRELGADRVVDLATLTGAIVVALGSTYAGLISNDDAWAAEVAEAARAHRRAGLAPAASPGVQGADQGHGRRPHQRLGQAQGRLDLRGLVPGGVRRRQAMGSPRHRRHRLGRRPRLRRQRANRVRRPPAGRARARPGRLLDATGSSVDFDLTDDAAAAARHRARLRPPGGGARSPRSSTAPRRSPTRSSRKLGELGLMGIPFPEEYGGGGADTLSYALAVEELARVDSSVCITLAAHTSLGTMPIHLWGSRPAEVGVAAGALRRPAAGRLRPDRARRRLGRRRDAHHARGWRTASG